MVSRATWQTPICDADAALRQLRFLMVVLSTAVSRYASPRPRIGEYLTGLDSAFVPSPDSPEDNRSASARKPDGRCAGWPGRRNWPAPARRAALTADYLPRR